MSLPATQANRQQRRSQDQPIGNLGYGAAANYLGISVRTLKRLKHDRQIPFVEVTEGRVVFRLADLDRFNEARLVKPRRRRGEEAAS